MLGMVLISASSVKKEIILDFLRINLKPEHEVFVKGNLVYLHVDDYKRIDLDFALKSIKDPLLFGMIFRKFNSDEEMMWDIILKPEEFK